MREGPKGPKKPSDNVVDIFTRKPIRSERSVQAQQKEARNDESIMELDENGLRAARRMADAIIIATENEDRATLGSKRREMDVLTVHKLGTMILSSTKNDIEQDGAHYRAVALTFIEKHTNRVK